MVNVSSQPLQRGDDFISPFDEDYDVPAFIRRAHPESEQIG